MRILFAGDEHTYSEYALKETIKLAMNTWADVTLVGIQAFPATKDDIPDTFWPSHLALNTAMRRYSEMFLNSWPKGDSPYENQESQYEGISIDRNRRDESEGLRRSRKEFVVLVKIGNPGPAILVEANDDQGDLIVLGCTKGDRCVWEPDLTVPQQVVNDADCSVLLVKEDQPVTRILACLDQTYISQESLEMINQMVTIHGAHLELIGLSQSGDIDKSVYDRLMQIGDYYSAKDVEINTRLTDISDFEKFISSEIRNDLLALWVGNESSAESYFSKDWVGRFVSKCQNSVLVMR